jgi:hypothetical protein
VHWGRSALVGALLVCVAYAAAPCMRLESWASAVVVLLALMGLDWGSCQARPSCLKP